MGKKISAIALTTLFIFMIMNPRIILDGAKTGITLWFEAVLPSLLPYMIISNLVIQAGISDGMAYIMRPLTALLGLNRASGYCILSGIFFGYPSCALTASQMYKKGEIGRDTANFCVCAFNSISPAFIAGFFCTGILESPSLIAPVLILFYIILLLSTFLIKICLFRNLSDNSSAPTDAPLTKPRKIIDTAIMSALTNIAKLGGYIVVFSIIAAVLSFIPWRYTGVVCGIAEVTTGIQKLSEAFGDRKLILVLVMPLLSFGGVSGIFQTFGVDTEGVIDKKKYILSKLILAGVSAAVTTLAVYGLKIVR